MSGIVLVYAVPGAVVLAALSARALIAARRWKRELARLEAARK